MANISTVFPKFTAPNGEVVPAGTTIRGDGLVYRIGDGLYLSAAHIPYEYYSVTAANGTISSGARDAIIRIGGSRATISKDIRGYYNAATLAGDRYGGDPETRPAIVNKDMLLLNGSGDVGAKSAGLVVFLDTKDMLKTTPLGVLEVKRDISNKSGSITAIDTSQFGVGSFLFSNAAIPGESGDAYTLKFDSKKFVFGVQTSSGSAAGVPTAVGNYLTKDEFTSINDAMEKNQAPGNVTTSEPTNLIFGSDAADSAVGTYRPDILLGRAGNDTLKDGDGSRADGTLKTVYANDRLFGGAGDDVLMAFQGNDLLHGGDHRAYGTTPRISLEDDGIDTASYADFRAAHASNPAGIAIMVTANATLKDMTTFATQNPDIKRDAAVFVRDLSTDPQYIGSVDTLISIEKIIGTDAADVLNIDSLTGLKLAGADGKGGLREVDLGESAQGNLTNFAFANLDQGYTTSLGALPAIGPYLVRTLIPVGDTIDLHGLNEAARVDLSLTAPSVSAKSAADRGLIVYGAENIIGSAYDDILINNVVNGVTYGGDGNDTLYATGSGRSYAFGGAGDDIIYGGKNSAVDTFEYLQGMGGADTFKAYIATHQFTVINDIEAADKIYVNDTLIQGTFQYSYTTSTYNPYSPSEVRDVFTGNGISISYVHSTYYTPDDRGIRRITIDLLSLPDATLGTVSVPNFGNGEAGITLQGHYVPTHTPVAATIQLADILDTSPSVPLFTERTAPINIDHIFADDSTARPHDLYPSHAGLEHEYMYAAVA